MTEQLSIDDSGERVKASVANTEYFAKEVTDRNDSELRNMNKPTQPKSISIIPIAIKSTNTAGDTTLVRRVKRIGSSSI